MPELPEVETICRGIAKAVLHLPIIDVVLHHPHLHLRYPIPRAIKALRGSSFHTITRRGKYLLLSTANHVGTLILHLGMSGRLLLLPQATPPFKHEHLTLTFHNGLTLRFIDPRRFGAILWTDAADPLQHSALENLGIEPLDKNFNAHYLYKICHGRCRTTIKQLIMNGKVVVGIGNIYAGEALFLSHIHPQRVAATLTLQERAALIRAIKQVLRLAIKCGGTTIRDFVASDGATGSFVQQLLVYGRAGQPCRCCGGLLQAIRLGQRSTVYCPRCQK